eukprot:500092-Pelagomonas_calceolata.AAC.7
MLGTCDLRVMAWMLMAYTRQDASGEIVFDCLIGTIMAHKLGVEHRAKERQHQRIAARRSRAPTPAPKINSMSDSSTSNSGCRSADRQESARKEQASEPATVAGRTAEF